MLDLGEVAPGARGEDGGKTGAPASTARSVLLTLVPNSSIQFVDFEMSEVLVAQTRRRFFEEAADGGEPSLHVAATSDGVFHHPLTGAPCDPARTYAIGGGDALAPFLDTWLPLPFMRVSRREDDDTPVLDEGPSNWTRVFVTRQPDESGHSGYRVVLAIDTSIEFDAASPSRAYVGPTHDDLKSGAPFRFSDDVADVAWFVSEAWVDDWIKAAFDAGRKSRESDANQAGALAHLAGYLTVLAVLKEACDLPALRFMEPNAVGAFADMVPVDLALDLGTSRIGALIQERNVPTQSKTGQTKSGAAGDPGVAMWQLALRDLSQPARVVAGPCASRLTFSRAAFGNEALSRWSGRMRAFHWPSPSRIGAEADRIARETSAPDAMTGVSSPMHYVWDERPSRHVWRFAGHTAEVGERRNPVVSGSILAYLTEAGDLIEGRGAHVATTKPRFSRSSLVSLLAAEIIMHTIGAINSPDARAQHGKSASPRRLERILLTPPAGMSEHEVAILRRRVEAAVKLVWQSMGWSIEGHELAPLPPTVVVVADAATSTQVAYLENEIAYKFRGRSDSLLAIAGRARSGFAGARALRIATLDVGAAMTGLSVATWEAAPGGALAASRQIVDGFEIGCDDVVEAIAARFILPALEERLTECRHADPRKLFDALLGPDDRNRPAWAGDLGRRLVAEMLAPAATALLKLYANCEADAGDAPSELTLATLLASVGVDAKLVSDRLDIVAADDGADGFAPLDVSVTFLMRDLATAARQALRPMLDSVVRVVGALDCDLILLTGEGTRLPVLSAAIVAGMPVRPDRVVNLHEHRFASWYPGRELGDPKLLGVAGALLQARGTFSEGGPAIVVRPLDRAAQAYFIGKLDRRLLIRQEDMLFEIAGGIVRDDPRGASTVREAPAQSVRTVIAQLPTLIGRRSTSIESWPARVAWVIERNPDSAGRGPKLPLRVTLELVQPERGQPAGLKLVSAIDGDGGRLDPSEIILRLKTRSFADGHWLDSGHFASVPTGTGQ